MPLHTHVGPGSPYYSEDPFIGGLLWSAEASFWVHRPLWFFILGGVLEKHPTLKLVFTEQGVEWVPGALMMMDFLLEAKITPFSESERKQMYSIKPSEYFFRQCWIGATNTDALGWVTSGDRETLGSGRLMWGSDYPHMESAWPQTREKLRDLMKGIAGRRGQGDGRRERDRVLRDRHRRSGRDGGADRADRGRDHHHLTRERPDLDRARRS